MLIRRRSRAPIDRAGINWGASVLRSCTFLGTMGDGAGATVRDLVAGRNLDFSASGAPAWNPGGRGGRAGPSVGHTAVAGTGALGTTAVSNLFSSSTATLAVWWRVGNASAPANAAAQNGSALIADSARVIGIARTNVSSGGDLVHFYHNDGAIDVVSTTYSNTDWNFDVLVHSGGALFAYHNGRLAGSTASGNSTSLTGTLQVAASGTGRCLIGAVDFAATWSRALDANEILSLYDRPWHICARPRRTPVTVIVPTTATSETNFALTTGGGSFELTTGGRRWMLCSGGGAFSLRTLPRL